MECPICESEGKFLFRAGQYDYLKCQRATCGAIWISLYPDHTLGDYDKDYHTSYDKPEMIKETLRQVGYIKKALSEVILPTYSPSIVELLEVGCSGGNLLTYLQAIGYKAWGMDLSEEALEIAKVKGIIPEQLSYGIYPQMPKSLDGKIFDLVIMIHLLEHIPNVHSAWRTLSQIAKSFYLYMPNANAEKGKDWVHINPKRPGEHCVFYTIPSILHLCNKYGFKITSCREIGDDLLVVGTKENVYPEYMGG